MSAVDSLCYKQQIGRMEGGMKYAIVAGIGVALAAIGAARDASAGVALGLRWARLATSIS
jgi:hypothetical protein